MCASVLAFQAFEITVETGFWSALAEIKLHHLKLEEGPISVIGNYLVSNDLHNPGFLTLEERSLELDCQPKTHRLSIRGDAYCLNTRGQLASFARRAAVEKVVDEIWSSIATGAAEQDPQLLQRVVLLTYCDLKHYKNSYWLAAPALKPPAPFTLSQPHVPSLSEQLPSITDQVLAACTDFSAAHPHCPFWLLAVHPPSTASSTGAAHLPPQQQDTPSTTAAGLAGGAAGDESRVAAVPLSEWQQPQQAGAEVSLVMADCSNLPANPGWPLRNALLLAAVRWRVPSLQVVCLRRRRGRYDPKASIVLLVDLPSIPPDFHPAPVSGWLANRRTGRVEPSHVDLGPSMDPQRQAASAVNLNLSLMRWRASPSLNVSAIGATRCLLLGAGTLGCSVARCLLGWGVRHITFVDNSTVAFSNPVRQSLYNFEDCLHGGTPKAAAAAAAVQKIFPGAAAAGVDLTIPMPGHPIAASEVQKVLHAVAALEDLVHAHDVVFLLMDTRESRWLPTLLAAAAGKLAINSALGFDGFMVMRHGAAPQLYRPAMGEVQRGAAQQGTAQQDLQEEEGPRGLGEGRSLEGGAGGRWLGGSPLHQSLQDPPGWGSQRLGCYFCNDVVAPIDSTVDRTMDQQCTVARPGLSPMAGSLAVELMVAVLSHPLGASAPPAGTPASHQLAETVDAPLGEVPHMVRGQLGGFSQMCLSGQAFKQCTACSEVVLQRYKEEGHSFILQALQNPKGLEDLTGLTELQQSSQAVIEDWDSEDEAGQGSGESGGGQCGGGEDTWEEV